MSKSGAHGLDSSAAYSAGPSEVREAVHEGEVNDGVALGGALLKSFEVLDRTL